MSLDLYIWTFLLMLHAAPVERLPAFEGHTETIPEAMARYGSIASDIVHVCEARSTTPKSCAALLVAIGAGESGFSKDADVGPCFRGKYLTPWGEVQDHKRRCDGGRAASVWQAHAYGAVGDEPVTIDRLFADRKVAAWVALRAAHRSLRDCAKLPPGDRLFGLTGRCELLTKGEMKSARERYADWQEYKKWKVQP